VAHSHFFYVKNLFWTGVVKFIVNTIDSLQKDMRLNLQIDSVKAN